MPTEGRLAALRDLQGLGCCRVRAPPGAAPGAALFVGTHTFVSVSDTTLMDRGRIVVLLCCQGCTSHLGAILVLRPRPGGHSRQASGLGPAGPVLGDVDAAAAPCGHALCVSAASSIAIACRWWMHTILRRGRGSGTRGGGGGAGVTGPCPHLLAGQLCCLGMPGARSAV